MSKKFSILFAFLLLSIYSVPGVKQFVSAQTTFSFFNPTVVEKENDYKDNKTRIQLALLLDTSSSMNGLIGQAKSQLWKMVNELAESTKDGTRPLIEIALYEYGNDHLSARNGYIRQVAPLTTDLDQISEQLFQLKTQGGEEYCGYALNTALDQLNWSDNDENLKIVFIAGNESYAQGPISFREVSGKAQKRDVLVNTIFCGDYQKGISTFWKEGALLTNGQYMVINHNDVVHHIETPYDDAINDLNSQLNSTYLGYGNQGVKKMKRQTAQDSNASSYGKANSRSRASFKSKDAYNNAEWDVVDAVKADAQFLTEEEELLPEVLQELAPEARKSFVEDLQKKRSEIKKQIRELDEKVKSYVETQEKNSDKATLDNVMIQTVKQQAERKEFEF